MLSLLWLPWQLLRKPLQGSTYPEASTFQELEILRKQSWFQRLA
jgi:hypothetical protein